MLGDAYGLNCTVSQVLGFSKLSTIEAGLYPVAKP